MHAFLNIKDQLISHFLDIHFRTFLDEYRQLKIFRPLY